MSRVQEVKFRVNWLQVWRGGNWSVEHGTRGREWDKVVEVQYALAPVRNAVWNLDSTSDSGPKYGLATPYERHVAEWG